MLITPDLQDVNRIEKQLTLSFGADALVPVYSYLSLTEESEYTTTDEQYAVTLTTDQKLQPATPEFETAMDDFRGRMKKYRQDRVYPTLPDWPVVCFYNMTKRRGEQRNWYSLPFEERGRDGRTRASAGNTPASKQLITGSTGLTAEWGVTLLRTILSRSKRSSIRCASTR
jgi:chlorite dismutase